MPSFDTERFDATLFDAESGSALTIGGVDYAPYVMMDGFEFSQEINGAVGTLTFSVLASSGTPAFSIGAAVVFSDDAGNALFTGYLTRRTPEQFGPDKTLWKCSCQDLSRTLDRVYTGVAVFTNAWDFDIIGTIFAAGMPSVDASTNVSAVLQIASIDLSGKSLRQCLADISDRSGAIYYLDADSALHYFAAGERSAPFGLNENADRFDPGMGYGILADGASYSEDFTNPCNKATVQNMLSEDATLASHNPPASGDDGEVQRVSSSTEYPPTGAYTTTTNASTFTARNKITNPSSGNATPGEEDAESTYGYANSWPPPTSDGPSGLGAARVGAQYTDGAPWAFWKSCSFARFDTSGIPDAATITAAILKVTPDNLEDTEIDNPKLCGEYYASSNWPIDASDYTPTPSESAFYAVDFGDLAEGVESEITLRSPNSNINKTGYTGIRFHCKLGTGGSPQSMNSVDLTSMSLDIDYEYGGTVYTKTCAAVRFDTSALPDTAVVSGATLKLKVSAKAYPDGAQIGVEWYSGANWPLGDADWTNTPNNDAYGYVDLSTLPAAGSWWNIPLTTPTNVSLTGYTGFRIHIKTTAAPTGDNYVSFGAQDGSDDPVLEVNYVAGEMVSGSYQDDTSIAAYGTFEKTIVDAKILTAEEAEQRAETEVVLGAYPGYSVSVTTRQPGLSLGDIVYIAMASFGVSDSFLIRRISMVPSPAGGYLYTVDAGDFRDDLVQYLRELNA